ncbi:hypothetical protein Trydic_g10841 [Trypoxylus dichotomus]
MGSRRSQEGITGAVLTPKLGSAGAQEEPHKSPLVQVSSEAGAMEGRPWDRGGKRTTYAGRVLAEFLRYCGEEEKNWEKE